MAADGPGPDEHHGNVPERKRNQRGRRGDGQAESDEAGIGSDHSRVFARLGVRARSSPVRSQKQHRSERASPKRLRPATGVDCMSDDQAKFRYVVLRHDGIDDPHFDLMFESGPVNKLWTWRSKAWPVRVGDELTRLSDHRREYLDYEGPVSADRGF